MLFTLIIWHITEWIPYIINNCQVIVDLVKEFRF